MGRYCAASVSWPLASTVNARSRPQSVPLGRFTLAVETARDTSSMPMPRSASWRGSSWIRTAYFCAP